MPTKIYKRPFALRQKAVIKQMRVRKSTCIEGKSIPTEYVAMLNDDVGRRMPGVDIREYSCGFSTCSGCEVIQVDKFEGLTCINLGFKFPPAYMTQESRSKDTLSVCSP